MILMFAVVAVGLGTIACEYDYYFLAFEIECPLDDDGQPTRCYPVKRWNPVYCATFMSSPFEIWAGPYNFELDLDIPAGLPTMPFPSKFQVELIGYDMDGARVFRERFKRWRVDRQSGRVEQTVQITKDLVVPYGGMLCINTRTTGADIYHGWKAGFLFEPIEAASSAALD
jgi:hypothetical protein